MHRRLEPDDVLAEAERICRAEGIDAVTIRRLADALHWGRSTVHAAVRSTGELRGELRRRAAREAAAVLGGADWMLDAHRRPEAVASELVHASRSDADWLRLGFAPPADARHRFDPGVVDTDPAAADEERRARAPVLVRRLWLAALVRWIGAEPDHPRTLPVATAVLGALDATETLVPDGAVVGRWPEPRPVGDVVTAGADPDRLILDACRAIIRAGGATGISVRRVAELTYLGKSTVHHRVGCMDDYLSRLRAVARDEFGTRLAEVTSTPQWRYDREHLLAAVRLLRADASWVRFGLQGGGQHRRPASPQPGLDDLGWGILTSSTALSDLAAEMMWAVAGLAVLVQDEADALVVLEHGFAAMSPALVAAGGTAPR